ncbi:MAG: ABC transporter ATP-binding protein [Peptoniphilaceae bacterium]|uniref:ABC transporter ATP-binding protein n=1 Tax=Parvimonas sp. TaxID=1944660 RepID=UPI0025E44FA0|nr:ABC transporter ATP-binding protein [Parvimonas sp.]MCI5997322.1 ABC transporter ATP-binding protein [Parvimonas sp.]MDD7764474.1 ABC transporter ATP-binding protein [Peptoniphilaceae bacterium]MDY3051125.1 ABC transporter ATP-binding protein [Parvimonas sp.]
MEESRYDFGKYKTFVNVFNASVMNLINISSFVIIAYLLYKKEITAGIATATIAYIQDFLLPLRTIIDSVSLRKSVETVMSDIISEISENKNLESENVKFVNNIRCNNVSFKYDDYIIKDFSYTFKKNKKYAIIGESGKGKSTFLNLINGNITCTGGSITIDDRKVSYRFCNQLIMYLTQKSHIFSTNFWNNVSIWGSFDKTILEKGDKYIPENKVEILLKSENNNELSGGEKQLVNYLRAVLSGREILLLDEPFSAMDKAMENYVCNRLLEMKDKTIIMITHNVEKEFLDKFDHIIYM